MIDYTLQRIAQVVGGTLDHVEDPEIRVTGSVEFDSRKIGPGDLFIALPGQRVDGHDFAEAAVKQGAVAVIAARPVGVPAIVVEPAERSPVEAVVGALTALATEVAEELITQHGLKVVGITGSSGKTSTKDLAAAVLSQAGSTVAPPGSFNNEIGHPYTVLRCGPDTDFLIAEMSARRRGHIAHLAKVARPSIGAVLNVGSAHLGEFGSRENIALAKAELVEALPSAAEGGLAIINVDDPFVAGMASQTTARVVRTSCTTPPNPEAEYRATNVVLDDVARASFTLHTPSYPPQQVSLQVFGSHQVSNALAAAAAGIEAGMDAATVAQALSDHRAASAHRMDVNTRADGVTIINDAYNANPESMRAGIAALAFTASARQGARSIAVLGEMGELGSNAIAEHEQLGKQLARFNVTHLCAVGDSENVRALACAAAARGVRVATVSSNEEAARAVEKLTHQPHPEEAAAGVGDVVLVKASNAAALWEVAERLLAPTPPEN